MATAEMLETLRQRVKQIDPDTDLFEGYGKALWVRRKGHGTAALRLLADGTDLATGLLRRMGWTDEQRRAIAAVVTEWRAGR